MESLSWVVWVASVISHVFISETLILVHRGGYDFKEGQEVEVAASEDGSSHKPSNVDTL